MVEPRGLNPDVSGANSAREHREKELSVEGSFYFGHKILGIKKPPALRGEENSYI